jgi:hypothetical protein
LLVVLTTLLFSCQEIEFNRRGLDGRRRQSRRRKGKGNRRCSRKGRGGRVRIGHRRRWGKESGDGSRRQDNGQLRRRKVVVVMVGVATGWRWRISSERRSEAGTISWGLGGLRWRLAL